MILFKRAADLRRWLKTTKAAHQTTGFVPTMGALHKGHLQLIGSCRSAVDYCICSIFINPAQFNDPADFEQYPVSIERDIELLTKAGADVLFLPAVPEIYPQGDAGLEKYDLGQLESIWEGYYRPGHFQGVCQVMSRLLKTVEPDHLFLGQKDFQQCLVIKKLIEILHLPLVSHTVQTIRENDGLAFSSRNLRLTPEQRKNATAIFQALCFIRDNLVPGDVGPLLDAARKKLDRAHFKTDYISIARTKDLQAVRNWDGTEKTLALIAAFQGEIRLIDNMLLYSSNFDSEIEN